MKILIPLIIFALFFSSNAHTQNFNNILDSDFADLELGGGYSAGNKFREEFDGNENDSFNGITPLGRARITIFNIGNIPGVVDWNQKGFRLGTVTQYNWADAYETEGIERNGTFMSGGFIGYESLVFMGIADIASKHSGAVYTLRYSPLVAKWSKSTLHMVFKANLYNRKYVNYYFGISEEDVTNSPNFSTTYTGDDTYSGAYELHYNQPLGGDWRFMIYIAGEVFGGGVGDSPTVKSNFRVYGAAGWLYTFF